MKMRLGRLLIFVRHRPLRLAVLVLVLLVLLGISGYRAARHFYVKHHLDLAEREAVRYDFDAAEQHLADGLWADPNNALLHLRMARAARRAGHYDRAEQHLRQCQQLEGKNAANALEAILLRVQTGDIVENEALLLKQAILRSPDANLILEALAQGYIHIYHLDAAMGCLNWLLEHEPNNVSALLLRASLENTAGNYTGALADCRQAVEGQPDHRDVRLRLAQQLLITEQPDEALRQFDYLRQQPGGVKADVLLGLARSHRQLGHVEIARQTLDELLARNPHDGFALLERGKIALENESPAAAEKWFRQAVADYPFDAQSNYLLIQALRKQDKDEEVRRYEAIHARIEDDAKALRMAFERVTKNPQDPEPRLEAARICLRNGREDEGERWLLSGLEQVPQHAATRAALADYYQRHGKTDLAALYRHPLDGKTATPR